MGKWKEPANDLSGNSFDKGIAKADQERLKGAKWVGKGGQDILDEDKKARDEIAKTKKIRRFEEKKKSDKSAKKGG